MSADSDYNKATSKAEARYTLAVADAGGRRERALKSAGEALRDAERVHADAVSAADRTCDRATGTARTERDQVVAEALSKWSTAVRDELGVPKEAFLRKDAAGRLLAHEGPGTPQVGSAYSAGDHWVVDTAAGRAFASDEQLARRMLWQATVAKAREIESSVMA